MPLTPVELVTLVGLPFVAAVLLGVIARLMAPRRLIADDYGDDPAGGAHPPAWPIRLALPLAIALGPLLALAVTPLAIKDVVVPLHVWPTEARDWYLLATVPALALGVAAVWMPRRFSAVLFATLGALLALRLSLNGDMTVPVELWPTLAAPGFLYFLLDPIARHNHNLAMLIILLLLAGSAVLVEADGISPLHGFTCLPIASALFGLLVVYALLPDRDFSRAALPAFMLLFLAVLFYGYFEAGVSWQRTLILLCAPVAAYIADIPPMHRMRPFWKGALRVVLVAIPLCFAVIPAARDLSHPEQQNATPEDI